jgi:hypothetical protein
MGFRIHCDACGSFIKIVGIREIRDMNYVSDEGTHCQPCTRKFDGLAKQIEKLQKNYVRKLDALARKAQKDMEKLISDLAKDDKRALQKEEKEEAQAKE